MFADNIIKNNINVKPDYVDSETGKLHFKYEAKDNNCEKTTDINEFLSHATGNESIETDRVKVGKLTGHAVVSSDQDAADNDAPLFKNIHDNFDAYDRLMLINQLSECIEALKDPNISFSKVKVSICIDNLMESGMHKIVSVKKKGLL